MKHLLLTTIAAVLVVGCGTTQQTVLGPEAKPVEPVAEAAKPEPPTAKTPVISIHVAVFARNIEDIKQHLAAGTHVNAKESRGWTPLLRAAREGYKEIVELLIANGADVNAKTGNAGWTPLHWAAYEGYKEIVELLIASGADVNAKVESGPKQGLTPLDAANGTNHTEIADLLRKHGGKTGEELKAEGN